MKGVKKPLEVRQGKTYVKPFRLATKVGNNLIDLNNYTARMHVREQIESTDTILELTTENGGIVIDGDIGKFTIVIPAEDTAALTVGNYVYDVELIAPDTETIYGPIIPSAFKVKPEVTR